MNQKQISVHELMAVIGEQTVQIKLLEAQIQQMTMAAENQKPAETKEEG